jgi:hypothetical protein
MPGAKRYPREQWDEFFCALEALPEKPRSEQRVTVSEAMKEMRAQIVATRAKGYTLAEINHPGGGESRVRCQHWRSQICVVSPGGCRCQC